MCSRGIFPGVNGLMREDGTDLIKTELLNPYVTKISFIEGHTIAQLGQCRD
jgi:hypothetical protein